MAKNKKKPEAADAKTEQPAAPAQGTDSTSVESAGPKESDTAAESKPQTEVVETSAKADAKAKQKTADASGPVRVKSLVNMHTLDNQYMEVDKEISLSRAEYNRLKADVRGPFFKEF